MKSPAAILAFASVLAFAANPAMNAQEKPDSTSKPGAPQRPGPDMQALVQGNNEFAFDLYRQLSRQEGNLVFSPYSISTALAMTYAGAKGDTAAQIAKVLHFQDQKATHQAFARLDRELRKLAGPLSSQLYVANGLWGQRGYPFHKEFLTLILNNYEGGFQEVDFANDPDGARRRINEWVMKQTKDRIEDLLHKSDIEANTRLLLANALWFKAAWKYPFDKGGTKKTSFYLEANKTIPVPMMVVGYNPFRYHAAKDFQLVELPYRDDRFAMLVILPTKETPLQRVEETFTRSRMVQFDLHMHHGKVELPRFQVISRLPITNELVSMGMTIPFSSKADFSGLTSAGGLKIDSVIHKAFIDVVEEGTEAAAATAVLMGIQSLPRFDFKADRPFLFLIRDNQTGSVLFVGRVVHPGKMP